MRKREPALLGIVLVGVALTAIVMGGAGFGGCNDTEPATTTTAAEVSTTSVAPATTAGAPATTVTTALPTTTTAAGEASSSTATSAALSPALETYKTEMLAFDEAYMSLHATTAPSKYQMTDADLQGANKWFEAIFAAFHRLKAIQPPPDLATEHEQLVNGLGALVDAAEKLVQGIKSKDQAVFSGAQQECVAAAAGFDKLMQPLLLFINAPSS
jgi:hypothetical protein